MNEGSFSLGDVLDGWFPVSTIVAGSLDYSFQKVGTRHLAAPLKLRLACAPASLLRIPGLRGYSRERLNRLDVDRRERKYS